MKWYKNKKDPYFGYGRTFIYIQSRKSNCWSSLSLHDSWRKNTYENIYQEKHNNNHLTENNYILLDHKKYVKKYKRDKCDFLKCRIISILYNNTNDRDKSTSFYFYFPFEKEEDKQKEKISIQYNNIEQLQQKYRIQIMKGKI